MARSTSGITISMTCSTINTVTPVSRTLRTSSTPVFASTGVRPVSTSSSSSSFGSVASARATSSRRFSDGTRSLASTLARAGEATEFQHLVSLLPRHAHHGVAHQRADDDVVDHAHGLKTFHHLEGAADAAHAALGRRQFCHVLAIEPDRALRRRQHARDQVEQRRLAGAVGADQTDDLAAPDRNRDVAVGDEAAEPLPDAAGFQQSRHRAVAFFDENSPIRPCGRASEIRTISEP